MGKSDWTAAALKRQGFVGWHKFKDLPGELRSIDRSDAGVYVVYRDTSQSPVWLSKSPGATWRGDPTVEREVLVNNWVPGAKVLYIGKAKLNQLRNRLRAYHSFGHGGKGRHAGGRLIWQLKGTSDLLVAWRVVGEDEDARDIERAMIQQFVIDYGQRPFANLAD